MQRLQPEFTVILTNPESIKGLFKSSQFPINEIISFRLKALDKCIKVCCNIMQMKRLDK